MQPVLLLIDPIIICFNYSNSYSDISGELWLLIAVLQVLSFADGETTRTVNVQIFDDDIAEDDETFELILNNPTGGLQLGNPSKGKNNDSNDN